MRGWKKPEHKGDPSLPAVRRQEHVLLRVVELRGSHWTGQLHSAAASTTVGSTGGHPSTIRMVFFEVKVVRCTKNKKSSVNKNACMDVCKKVPWRKMDTFRSPQSRAFIDSRPEMMMLKGDPAGQFEV